MFHTAKDWKLAEVNACFMLGWHSGIQYGGSLQLCRVSLGKSLFNTQQLYTCTAELEDYMELWTFSEQFGYLTERILSIAIVEM